MSDDLFTRLHIKNAGKPTPEPKLWPMNHPITEMKPPYTTEQILQAEIDRVMEPYEFKNLNSNEECEAVAALIREACERLGLEHCEVSVESSIRSGVSSRVDTPYGDAPDSQEHWPEMTWERWYELYPDGGREIDRQIQRRADNDRRLEEQAKAREAKWRKEWDERYGVQDGSDTQG